MHAPIKYFEKGLSIAANGAWVVFNGLNQINQRPSFIPKSTVIAVGLCSNTSRTKREFPPPEVSPPMPTLRNVSFQFGKRVTVHISTKLE